MYSCLITVFVLNSAVKQTGQIPLEPYAAVTELTGANMLVNLAYINVHAGENPVTRIINYIITLIKHARTLDKIIGLACNLSTS